MSKDAVDGCRPEVKETMNTKRVLWLVALALFGFNFVWGRTHGRSLSPRDAIGPICLVISARILLRRSKA